jgi:hypothetical protein
MESGERGSEDCGWGWREEEEEAPSLDCAWAWLPCGRMVVGETDMEVRQAVLLATVAAYVARSIRGVE